MSKIVKLKISDLEKIVKNVLKEGEFDDFDTQIHPEETKGYEDYEAQKELEVSDEMHNPEDLFIGKDPQGNVIVMDTKTNEILGVKKI